MERYEVGDYYLIYVYAIYDEKHRGLRKVGMTSFSSYDSIAELPPNCPRLNEEAHKRIAEQTRTALVDYDLLYTELAVRWITMRDGSEQTKLFTDKDVHRVLERAGIRIICFTESGRKSEWCETEDLELIKAAIAAVKAGRSEISPAVPVGETEGEAPIVYRAEQIECVEKTEKIFKAHDTMLWNCKMRFGKTVTAYEHIKRSGYLRSIVITHRPAAEDSWITDHKKILERTGNRFIDKTNGSVEYDGAIDAENDRALWEMVEAGTPFVYFASIQDLRGSARVGGKYNKNNAVFDIDWDLLIVDEAHEGTLTELGDAVISALHRERTRVLFLSGTPYNIMSGFEENQYTWTYVDEQRAKKTWEEEYPDEPNPYASLPQMHIYTFDLSDELPTSYRFATEDAAFNFREFFRTWTGDVERDHRCIPRGSAVGDFVHEEDVQNFLTLISDDSPESLYPFSSEAYRDMFAHTFWIVPGVREARALSAMIRRHPRFAAYEPVNIAGDGDEEKAYSEALSLVRASIRSYPRTITISCGKLTTGVTVPEWSAIMMLSGSASTSASGYMQAIFRVQSPGCIDGRQKTNCYVFDFAPDRALKVIADVHKVGGKGARREEEAKAALGEFINFCPIISVEGTAMRSYDVDEMMRQIKRISVDAAINSGFDDDTIYLAEAGMHFSRRDEEVLRKLSDVVAPKKKGARQTEVIVADAGMTDEQRKTAERAKRKPKRELTQEEKVALELYKRQKEEQKKLFDLLRAVSIRLPILFYGADADITQIIRLKDFVELVDDESWEEFMPRGLRKDLFLDILHYYDEDVVVGAGLRIRRMAKAADELPPTQRVKRIVEILSRFKNPDKETVLTPWRVVNLHMGKTLGGYNFFDEGFERELEEPRVIDNGDVTAEIFLNEDARVLEMNSKSGLYPLYLAVSFYRLHLSSAEEELPLEVMQEIWFETLDKHIFVLCKTKMARMITIRTLAGYSDRTVHAIYLTKLVSERMKDLDRLSKKLRNPETWNIGGDRMKFDAVVGNPPYQIEGKGDGNGKDPIYHLFIDTGRRLSDKGTFIHPGRFLFNVGKTPKEWNEKMLRDSHYKVVSYWSDSTRVFPSVSVKGGIAITYWDANTDFGEIGFFSQFDELRTIVAKVVHRQDFTAFSEIVYPRDLYRLTEKLYEENEWADGRASDGHRYDVGSNIFEIFPELFYDKKPSDSDEYARICGRDKNGRCFKWIKRTYLKTPDNFDFYKVFVPKANGSGAIGEVLSTPVVGQPVVGQPVVGHTVTFLSVGKFDTAEVAEAVLKYIKTRFARTLLGALKVTQDNAREVWKFVPLQDFTSESNIDWSVSVAEIDQQLYAKYGLDEREIRFIESMIKPME